MTSQFDPVENSFAIHYYYCNEFQFRLQLHSYKDHLSDNQQEYTGDNRIPIHHMSCDTDILHTERKNNKEETFPYKRNGLQDSYNTVKHIFLPLRAIDHIYPV